MSAERWVGRVGRGWTLIRDAAEISVAEVYHLFVFRPGAKLSSRQSGQELDRLAHELACGVEERLQISLEDLFHRAAAPESMAAAPKRIQAIQG
jgi:DNA-binding IscR family transcriptional regulator